jgi:hypothetical protein
MPRSTVVALVFAVAAGPLAAQRLEPPLPHWEPSFQSAALAPKAPVPDYRWEGLEIGGAFVGLLGAALGNGLCKDDESGAKRSCVWPTLEGFVVGAVIGGVTGGLLGSAFRKPPPDDPEHP